MELSYYVLVLLHLGENIVVAWLYLDLESTNCQPEHHSSTHPSVIL